MQAVHSTLALKKTTIRELTSEEADMAAGGTWGWVAAVVVTAITAAIATNTAPPRNGAQDSVGCGTNPGPNSAQSVCLCAPRLNDTRNVQIRL